MKDEGLKSHHKLTFSDGFQRETVPPVDNYKKAILQNTGFKWGNVLVDRRGVMAVQTLT